MTLFSRAAEAIQEAKHLYITAGAGMGVDSGLPDFRGDEGFWRAYPALRGYPFQQMANPRWFVEDPTRAWGFYGHRLNLYRERSLTLDLKYFGNGRGIKTILFLHLMWMVHFKRLVLSIKRSMNVTVPFIMFNM